jgi:hypothetical protein
MFSAWDFADWIRSVGIATLMLGILGAFSALVSYAAIWIWGQEEETTPQLGRGETRPEEESPVRHAA